MRRFCSYGPVDTDLHYYVPRRELVERTLAQLVGDDPDKGGHYVTMWAPRQRGKTWVMQQVFATLRNEHPQFETAVLALQHLNTTTDVNHVVRSIAQKLAKKLSLDVTVDTLNEFDRLFERDVLDKPLILILDEFDALPENAISGLAGVFRNIYVSRQYQTDRPSGEKDYLLHGMASIGVRAVLGVESQAGSPFNVQRNVRVPNLTFEEVESMYRWYERESGQAVEQAVIDRVFYETRGQPGLVSWLGELLTETYNHHPTQPLTMRNFDEVYSAAVDVLPNNNILNIVSKAKQEPYRNVVLELFRTDKKTPFAYDDPHLNFLYLNGVIDWEQESLNERYVRFSSPFVQKRLFNYFARTLLRDVGRLYVPFEDLGDTITEDSLNVENLLRRFGAYLHENQEWLLKKAPRRADLRLYEAVYHFSLYTYLSEFLRRYKGQVWPEFPTGNGRIDLIIRHAGRVYGLEVKSFTNAYEYRESLGQAAEYGQQLGLDEITLAFFVETIDEDNRAKYEVVREDQDTGVMVTTVFVATGT